MNDPKRFANLDPTPGVKASLSDEIPTGWKMTGEQHQAVINELIKENGPLRRDASWSWNLVVEAAVHLGIVVPRDFRSTSTEATVNRLRSYAAEDWTRLRQREADLITQVADLQNQLERKKPPLGYRYKTVCIFCDRQHGHDTECAEKFADLRTQQSA